MAFLLDVIASSFIGGFIILMLLSLNIQLSDSSRESFENTHLQSSVITISEVIEYDFYKIGYNVDSNFVLLADSTRLRFCADIADSNNVDTIYYYTGTTNEASFSENPNDFPLYRVKNGIVNRLATVSEFKLTFLDSTSSQILPATLFSSQVARNQIKSIQVNFLIQSFVPLSQDSIVVYTDEGNSVTEPIYEGAEFQKIITLKNIFYKGFWNGKGKFNFSIRYNDIIHFS